MANWQVISLDTTTPQLRAPGTGDGYSFNSGSTQLGVWTTTGLGIGTASPVAKLNVVDSTTNSYAAAFRGVGGTNLVALGTTSGGASISGYTAGFAAATDLIVNPSGGNLGLGVTPSAWDTSVYRTLQVGSGPGSAALFGRTDNANNVGLSVNFYVGAGNTRYIANGTASYYNQQNGIHSWHFAPTNTSGAGAIASFAQAMTLDAAGRLLVGGTSAVVGSANGSIEVQNTSANQMSLARFSTAGEPAFFFNRSRGATVGTNTIVNDGDFLGSLVFRGANGTGYDQAAYILAAVDGTPGASGDMPGRLVFATSADGSATPTERMRITSAGQLLVGKTATTAAGTLISGGEIQGTVTSAAGATFQSWNQATSGDNLFVAFYTEGGTGTQRGSIDYNRAGGQVRYNTTSDYRAKEVYGPVDDSGEQIDALKVYRGKMLGATQERPMMIAHEAQEVVPYAVGGEKDAVNEDGTPKYQTMDHQILVPLLIAELQSLRKRVAELEAK